uniref:Uncharacterized protein n=1 Tax=Pipistrellus kuhlii TaxID=59472 RepID=A0A7J7XBA2_PIPKU|nr:hypothetical protein mPipKuh1_010646 [Pipistrellus kuhlii]
MNMIFPPGSFIRCSPSPSPSFTARFTAAAWWARCAVHEGTGDAHGAAGDFPQSRGPRAGSPLATKTRGSRSPVWKKCPAALGPTSQNLSVLCVCVCVHAYTMRVGHTHASFFKGRLYIYI